MTRWVKGFMKCKQEHDHEERLCIQKIVSSKEEKLERYEPPPKKTFKAEEKVEKVEPQINY